MQNWLFIAVLVGLCVLIGSSLKYRALPLLFLLALQPLKQVIQVRIPLFRVVDPTLLVTIWLAMVVLFLAPTRALFFRNAPKASFLVQAVLACLAILSLLWTPAPVYGSYKALRFALLNTLVMVAPLSLLSSRRNLVRFTIGVILIAVLVYGKIAVAPSYKPAPFGEAKFFRGGFVYGAEAAPQSLQLAGAFCIGLCWVVRSNWLRILLISMLIPLIVGAWVTGTRASVLAILASGPLAVLLMPGSHRIRKAALVTVVLIAVSLAGYLLAPEAQRGRITAGLFGVDVSGQSRLGHWRMAVRAFLSNPFGIGMGGYSAFGAAVDQRWFPHNIALEALAELGALGFLGLCALFGAFASYIWKCRRALTGVRTPARFLADAWLVGTAATFIVAMITDDLADNRSLWMGMGVCIVAYQMAMAEVSDQRAYEIYEEMPSDGPPVGHLSPGTLWR